MCQDVIDPAFGGTADGGTPLAKKEFQRFKKFNSALQGRVNLWRDGEI